MTASLDIAFFGASLVSAFANGRATYFRGVVRALAARGHKITFYEPDAYERQRHRDIDDPTWARVVVYPATVDGVHQSLRAARSADFVVKASGIGVHDELLEEAALELQNQRTHVVYWDLDAPATLDRLRGNPREPLARLLPRYDLVLTSGGGAAVIEAYGVHGAKHCATIYNAVDPTTHYPAPAEPRFACDLAFLGNRIPDREARVEQFFLAPAARAPRRTFLLGGEGWADKPLPTNVRYVGHVYTRDHNGLFASTVAAINITRASVAGFGYTPAARLFEIAGAGACVITDAWVGLEHFLEPNREVLVARSGDDVVDIIETLDPRRAREMGDAARRRVLAEHTYAHRARDLEALLSGTVR